MTPPATVVAIGTAKSEAFRLYSDLGDAGYDVAVAPIDQIVSELGRGSRFERIVATQASTSDPSWASLRKQVSGSDATIILAQDRQDPAESWRTFSAGAVPWVPGRPPVLPTLTSAAGARAAALGALERDLGEQTADAYASIHSISDVPARKDAVDTFIEVGALALDRFRSRAGGPVPLEVLEAHLMGRLVNLDDEHFSRWWAMVELMVFRSAGVSLGAPPLRPVSRGDLVGAFHAATTIVRFTARRQWRRPADLFVDLVTREGRFAPAG